MVIQAIGWLGLRQSRQPRLAAALAALLLAACGSSSELPQAGGAAAALHRDGRWMVDAQGRVVLLHGVNAVWKLAPYFPPDEAKGFTAADADFLAANGFNAVRLGVLFAGVMPQPDAIDPGYLAQIDRVVQLLTARRIWVLLDFHQDMYNEKFQGEGFADWAVYDDGFPNDANYGFPGNEFASLALNHVYDNFWANTQNVWDRYRDAWKAVAARWRNQPYLLGYDLFNEPWPGQLWPLCFELDCTLFDAKLQAFYQHVLNGLREADAEHFAFLEPQQLFDFGAPSSMAGIDDPALGLSWHAYCSSTLFAPFGLPAGPDCTLLSIENRTAVNADAQADALDAVSLLSEFGASDDLDDIGRVLAVADAHLVGWTYWAYKNWSDPTGGATVQGLFADDSDLSTLKPKADLLIRPYAQTVAGTPTSMRFDAGSKVFTLTYTPNAATAPTEIFIPARHYPHGYTVKLQGAHATSAADATTLQLVNDAGADSVQVEVDPVPAP